MKVAVVNIKDITKDNPTLCLSPLRVFNDCHKCDKFLQKLQYLKKKHADENLSVDELVEKVIAEIPCKPKLKIEFVKLLKEKTKLLHKIAEVQKHIDAL